MMTITKTDARRVLNTVDAGLVSGVGKPVPGRMCVEAAVCYALGLPHGDDPVCVSRALRHLKITLNDANWSSDIARAKGLRRLALVQLGSDSIDDSEFSRRVISMTIRKFVPRALRAAASMQHDTYHRQTLLEAVDQCEAVAGARDATRAANAASRIAAYAAKAATRAAKGAEAAAYAAKAATRAAKGAEAAAYAAYAAKAAKGAEAAYAAKAAAYAAKAATRAAEAAAYAAKGAEARDMVLADFAEAVVQLLIEMDAPGAQWLSLTT